MVAPPAERPPNLKRVFSDLRAERTIRGPLPPGDLGFRLSRSRPILDPGHQSR